MYEYFGGMLTKKIGIAFVRHFNTSLEESKTFYSLNTSFFMRYTLFQK